MHYNTELHLLTDEIYLADFAGHNLFGIITGSDRPHGITDLARDIKYHP
jgi:hypothetical protein